MTKCLQLSTIYPLPWLGQFLGKLLSSARTPELWLVSHFEQAVKQSTSPEIHPENWLTTVKNRSISRQTTLITMLSVHSYSVSPQNSCSSYSPIPRKGNCFLFDFDWLVDCAWNVLPIGIVFSIQSPLN